MEHKFDIAARQKLNSEERRKLLVPRETLIRLGFKNGDTMADIGCGNGLFVFPAAELSSADAKIYAIDISQVMLDDVISHAKEEHLQNIIPVKSEEYDFGLGDEIADFVLLCTVLHEVDDKKRLLAEAARICHSGGIVAVIEFNETSTHFGPPLNHRLPRTQVEDLVKGTGLSGVLNMEISEAFYAVTAVKR